MSNKLIILGHSNYNGSNVNKALIEAAAENKINVHNLQLIYPNANFNTKEEQSKLEAADEIIFQFPVHWFSTPWILKKYFDEVFSYGWAYGSGYNLKEKRAKLVVTTGVDKNGYTNGLPLKDALQWLKVTLNYCQLDYREEIFAFYGDDKITPSKINEYLQFIEK
ncbi:MAG: NAD(P)H-dependent oxidoreductase [Mangrovibacterium sp.]